MKAEHERRRRAAGVVKSRAGRRTATVVRKEYEHFMMEAKRNGWEDKLKCHDREYQFALYEFSPSAERAEAMCEGCPMLKLCKEFGKVTKPGWGVWGGVAYRYGQPAHEPIAELLAA